MLAQCFCKLFCVNTRRPTAAICSMLLQKKMCFDEQRMDENTTGNNRDGFV